MIDINHNLRSRLPAAGAIFDLDGVLVDTARFHFEGWQTVARARGFELSQTDGELLKGVSRDEALRIVLRIGGVQLDEQQRAKLAESKNRWFVERISRLDPSALLPGVKDALHELTILGVPIALASASKNAMSVLRAVGIADYFTTIVDGRAVTHAKPDPEVFLRAAAGLKFNPQRCVVFEDAPAGLVGARRAGCIAVGIGDPSVLGPNADLVVASVAEVQMPLLFASAATTFERIGS
jgi:beta-phosphoglucomutase